MISQHDLQAVVGHLTWFALLNRHTFAAFDQIYEATRALGESRAHAWPNVFGEVALFVALFPWLEADLRRPWQEHLVSSDASPSYGFGVAVARVSQSVVKTLGRFCTRPNTYVRLDRQHPYVDDEPARPRTGRAYKLGVSKAAFKTVISSQARHKANSGMLEAHAVTLSLRWLLRSPSRHARRTVLLVDAQAVCGALAKGRSSAPTLRLELKKIAALAIAGDIWLRIAYVPSEDNPSDAPSRGVVRIWRGSGARRQSNKVRKAHLKHPPRAHMVEDDIWRATHCGSASSRTRFRRIFRQFN